MTATITSRGEIVLRTTRREQLAVKPGDVLVASGQTGRIVLRKRKARRQSDRRTGYLTPRPLSPKVLERLYAKPSPEWDRVESEAVSLSRRALKGKSVEQL